MRSKQYRSSVIAWLASLAGLFILLATAVAAQAQTFTVIHTFTGGDDGAAPLAGLIMDRAGDLYGTASSGGLVSSNCEWPLSATQCGTAFQLKHAGSGWFFTPLYLFQGGSDGYRPAARMVFGTNGLLYGTTLAGGGYSCSYYTQGCGIVFQLRPPANACKTAICNWNETVIYRFDGTGPESGPLVFDQAGNLYGTAGGGDGSYVYDLSPGSGGWTQNVLSFFNNGDSLYNGVVFDAAGNLDGADAGAGYGGVYQLTHSGSGWTFHRLFDITDIGAEGLDPLGGVILDNAGNIYGSTAGYGPNGGGTVFELSAGTWNFNLLYGFSSNLAFPGPEESLTMDAAGNLYGTTDEDGAYAKGNVFKISPSSNGWIYTDLYDFTGGSDGAYPVSNVVIDAQGNLYGTTSEGGAGSCQYGCGTVWEITP